MRALACLVPCHVRHRVVRADPSGNGLGNHMSTRSSNHVGDDRGSDRGRDWDGVEALSLDDDGRINGALSARIASSQGIQANCTACAQNVNGPAVSMARSMVRPSASNEEVAVNWMEICSPRSRTAGRCTTSISTPGKRPIARVSWSSSPRVTCHLLGPRHARCLAEKSQCCRLLNGHTIGSYCNATLSVRT